MPFDIRVCLVLCALSAVTCCICRASLSRPYQTRWLPEFDFVRPCRTGDTRDVTFNDETEMEPGVLEDGHH